MWYANVLLLVLIGGAWSATTFTKKSPQNQIISEGEVSPGEYNEYIKYLMQLRSSSVMQQEYCNTHRHHSFFNIFRITERCPTPLQLYPLTERDGSKFGCNLEALPKPCVIYSIGSNGDFSWENAIARLGCEIHIFDCYYSGRGVPNRMTFHRWCVDGHDHNSSHYTIGSMMKMLGHSRIDFLKMDVEGAEFQSLAHLESLPKEGLPSQLAVEIHPWNELPNWGRTPAKLQQTIDLMLALHRMGYRLMSRFDNFPGPCCSEFLYGLPERLPGRKTKTEPTPLISTNPVATDASRIGFDDIIHGRLPGRLLGFLGKLSLAIPEKQDDTKQD